MKKRSILLCALPLFLLCGCGGGSGETLTRREIPTSTVEPTVAPAQSGDTNISQTNTGGATQKDVLVSEVKDLNTIPSLFVKKLASFKSYKAVTKGKTTASVLFINTDQSIEVTTIKGDYSYMKNESHSSLVNTSHEVYYHNNNAYYSDNSGEFKRSTLSEYLGIYGVYPFEQAIEGYSIDADCITKVEKKDVVDGTYTFKLTFDPEKATNNVRIQMKQFGGLDGYPKFEMIEINISIRDDFTPVKLELESRYSASKMVSTSCHQQYSVTYSGFNESIEIPNLAKAKENI